jgi:energy-converting hydrogenase Eha subunit B
VVVAVVVGLVGLADFVAVGAADAVGDAVTVIGGNMGGGELSGSPLLHDTTIAATAKITANRRAMILRFNGFLLSL